MSRKALWRDSNLVGTASAPTAKAKDGYTAAQKRAMRAVGKVSSRIPGGGAQYEDLEPDVVHAIDAMAIALYRASDHGSYAPQADEVMLLLVQQGWELTRIPDAD